MCIISSLSSALDGSHVAAIQANYAPLHEALRTHVETLHTERSRPPARSSAVAEAPVLEAPPLADPPAAPRLTTSGLFNVDESILEDVEKAEIYLSQSKLVRDFFEHLHTLNTPIRIQYVKNSNNQSGVGSNTKIEWDNRTYLESHDLENLLSNEHCGINSSALILLHELHHADWAISNPIGQHLLFYMPHPLYDNLEEARVVKITNMEALELMESIRGSHRGKMYIADDLFDRNNGVCNIKGHLPEESDLKTLYGTDEADAFVNFAVDTDSRKKIQDALDDRTSTINESLMKKLGELLDRHDNVGYNLVDRTLEKPEIPLPAALHEMYATHIDDAIKIAAELRGIG